MASSEPDVHVFLNYRNEDWEEPEKIFSDWITVGTFMAKPLGAIIAHHVLVPNTGRIIIEGDAILPLPSLSNGLHHANQAQHQKSVHSIFIVESNEDKILENLYGRRRGFEFLSHKAQRAFAHASWLFGQWLEQQATSLKLPTIMARPYDSLAERIGKAIEGL